MKIYGVYFAALINQWDLIIQEQLNNFFNSELFNKTDKFFIRIYYTNENELKKFKSLLINNNKIIITETNINEYEFGALKILENLSKTDNFYCYYFHSKGVSKLSNNFLTKNIKSWREYMEYFMIDKYDICLNELNLGWDAVGVKLRKTPNTKFNHFSGNFWWTKSKFINTLPSIDSLDLTKRHNAEFWIGYTNGKLKCIHNSTEAGYQKIITENYKI
jgi:hypothetical protein